MKVLVIDNAQPEDYRFNQPLIDFVNRTADSCDVVNYSDIPKLKKIEKNYGAVILSGVPLGYSFAAADNLLPYYSWLLETNVPVMGICLGHQIIGKLYGSKLIRNKEAENGTLDTYIMNYDSIFANIGLKFSSYLMHRASITVPADFDVLASTDKCKNIIMKHKNYPIYGMQLHPELSSVGAEFIKNFIELAAAYQTTTVKTSLLPSVEVPTFDPVFDNVVIQAAEASTSL